MDETVASYMADNIELFECDLNLVHSHHQMSAFLSGTDTATLRAEGNEVEAQIVEENAIAMNQVEVNVDSGIEKVEGLSFRKDYEILVVDATKVPAYINGTELRKIDLAQIKRFVKMTNNGVQIPRNTSKRN